MKNDRALTQERLKVLLDYDPATGIFTWKPRPGAKFRGDMVGRQAGKLLPNGYRHISVDHSSYYAHRLAWLWVHGVWPRNDVDHIDGTRDNNKFGNLRAANRSENASNRGAQANNQSGLKGVSFYIPRRKFRARICQGGKSRTIGYFATPEEAHAAYCREAKVLHGEFARFA